MPPVQLIVIGAGGRGRNYAEYALHYPHEVQIAGVAEPRDLHREQFAARHNIPAQFVFSDWRAAAAAAKFADGVIIATQDTMHAEPAVAFADRGYHIMLEKPMAPSPDECRRIVAAVKENNVLFAVCHVMRYTGYSQELKALLAAGRIGEIVSLQHLEPVGYWHQAHSFVRGNWRNEALSSPMLLSKSCHDMDWIRYMMDRRCLQLSSFGSLKHFRTEEKPAGAAERCLDCAVEPDCPYSAPRFYLNMLAEGRTSWPTVLTLDPTPETVLEALRTGPYGRCVYSCDNDVVDHQVVNMQFEGGSTASFTMTAFTRQRDRETHIFGTRGEIYGNGRIIEIYDFLSGESETIDTEVQSDGTILTGHGGGDNGIMRSFVAAVARQDPSLILSGPDETLETHLMVFAAEEARHAGTVVTLEEYAHTR
jgi:predicted dehydrogenase